MPPPFFAKGILDRNGLSKACWNAMLSGLSRGTRQGGKTYNGVILSEVNLENHLKILRAERLIGWTDQQVGQNLF